MTRWLLAFFVCLLFLSACSTAHYRASADKEVAKIIAQKTRAVPNMDPNFTIEVTNQLALKTLPVFDRPEEAFGEESESERGAKILSLENALEIAVLYGRDYQTRKESVYLTALTLTLDRHRYTPLF